MQTVFGVWSRVRRMDDLGMGDSSWMAESNLSVLCRSRQNALHGGELVVCSVFEQEAWQSTQKQRAIIIQVQVIRVKTIPLV